MTTATYAVEGMTCGHCEQAVSAAIAGIDGVTDVGVDLATGAVTVTSEAPLDDDAVLAAVVDAGYQLAS